MRLLAWLYLVEHSFVAEEIAKLAMHTLTTITGIYVTLVAIYVPIFCLTLLAALCFHEQLPFTQAAAANLVAARF